MWIFMIFWRFSPWATMPFMLRDEKRTVKNHGTADGNLNRKIVSLGEELGKPVCATCDVHFLNPEDEVYRRILMAGQGFTDADQQAPCICGPQRRC